MKKLLKNRAAIVLLVAVLTIWGFILNHIIEYLTSSGESTIEKIEQMEISGNDSAPSNNYLQKSISKLKPIKRDPFILHKVKTASKKTTTDKPPLKFNITGIIVNNNSKIVILEDLTDNSSHLLKRGEQYKTVKILDIKISEVKVRADGEVKVIDVK